jgi:pimeloyl-ACP methyl ester carboxylesterase
MHEIANHWKDKRNWDAFSSAENVYEINDGGLLKELGIDYNPEDGFAAALYYKNGRYYLAFRGTELKLIDWREDIVQALYGASSQYNQAVDLANRVQLALPSQEIILTGHSLGGGLAAAAAYATGLNAITFNAAGLHSNYMQTGINPKITNFAIRGDILTDYINGRSIYTKYHGTIHLPKAAGSTIYLSPRWGFNPIANHSLNQFYGNF